MSEVRGKGLGSVRAKVSGLPIRRALADESGSVPKSEVWRRRSPSMLSVPVRRGSVAGLAKEIRVASKG